MTAVTTEQNEQATVEGRERLGALAGQLATIRNAAVDARADTRGLTMRVSPAGAPVFEVPQAGLVMTVSENAHRQVADKLDIPFPYYERMIQREPALLAENVNTWLRKPETRLLRMLKPINDTMGEDITRHGATMQLRAFLGAGFRTLDNLDLLNAALPAIERSGAILRTFTLNEQRLYAEFVTFEQSAAAVVKRVAEQYQVTEEQVRRHHKVGGKDISWLDEVLRIGVALRNSETGYAELDISGLMEVLKCANDYRAITEFRRRHIGKRRTSDEGNLFGFEESDTTRRLDDATVFSRVGDAVEAVLGEASQARLTGLIVGGKAEKVELPVPLFEYVGGVAGRLQLTEAQTKLLQAETEAAVIEEGGTTRFAISQGITAMARQVEDMDQRYQFEKYGFEVLTLDAEKLVAAGRAGKN